MALPPDQGSGSGASPSAAAMLRRQMSACACAREEPVAPHESRLSASASTSTSFSSPASPTLSTSSSSTNYLPASNKLSSESLPFAVPEFGKLSSISSTSSYESFFHIEASDPGAEFLDFEPATCPPAVQTMMAQQQQKRSEVGAAVAYDPKRLPSSMFRTRSTASPGDWSVASNESLFSIQLSHNSGDLGAMYADLYYDAAGFPSFVPTGRDAPLRLPSLSESSVRSESGGCA